MVTPFLSRLRNLSNPPIAPRPRSRFEPRAPQVWLPPSDSTPGEVADEPAAADPPRSARARPPGGVTATPPPSAPTAAALAPPTAAAPAPPPAPALAPPPIAQPSTETRARGGEPAAAVEATAEPAAPPLAKGSPAPVEPGTASPAKAGTASAARSVEPVAGPPVDEVAEVAAAPRPWSRTLAPAPSEPAGAATVEPRSGRPAPQLPPPDAGAAGELRHGPAARPVIPATRTAAPLPAPVAREHPRALPVPQVDDIVRALQTAPTEVSVAARPSESAPPHAEDVAGRLPPAGAVTAHDRPLPAMPDTAAAAQHQERPLVNVHVSIESLEVTAPPSKRPAPRSSEAPAPRIATIDAYLAARRGGRLG